MQILDADLRRRLLEHHAPLGEQDPTRRLTADILERYETLVNNHFALRQIARQGIPFQWAYGPLPPIQPPVEIGKTKKNVSKRSTQKPARMKNVQASVPDYCLENSPFRILYEVNPASAQEAQSVVDNVTQEVRQRYIPDFQIVHDQWLAERASSEIGRANRATSYFFKSPNPGKGKFPRFNSIGTILTAGMLVGCMAVISLPRKDLEIPGPNNYDPPQSSSTFQLDDQEKQVLDQWLQTPSVLRKTETERLSYADYLSLKQAGLKLLQQSKLWQAEQNHTAAMERLTLAGEIGLLQKRVFDDKELLDSVQVVLRNFAVK